MHQGKYTKYVLKKFDMGEAKPLSTPMSTTMALDANEGEAVEKKEYRSMIGVVAVPDGNATGHPVHGVSTCALSGFAAHVSPPSYQADHEVPPIHS